MTSDSNTNTCTLSKVYENIFDFEFDWLDRPIGVYKHYAPASNHADAFKIGLYGPNLGLDRGYAEYTQITGWHDIEHASRQFQDK